MRKTIYHSLIVLTTTAIFASVGIAGTTSFDDETNAKVARLKAKQRMMAAQENASNNGNGGADKSKCGSVDIGNVAASKSGKTPKEVTVVISGDVINMGNKCK